MAVVLGFQYQGGGGTGVEGGAVIFEGGLVKVIWAEEVEDAGGGGADSGGKEHVGEVGDGGVGEHALDVVLQHADAGGEDGGGRGDDGYDAECVGAAVEEGMAAGDHVDAGRDHRRR